MANSDDVKAWLIAQGLPSEAEFFGYGVYLKDEDEYLADIEDVGVGFNMVWSKIPEMSVYYPSEDDVNTVIQLIGKGQVVLLFNLSDIVMAVIRTSSPLPRSFSLH